MKLTITRDQLTAIEQQARRALPGEACGLITGAVDSGGGATSDIIVAGVHPSENMAACGNSFEIDPALHMRLQRELRGSGEEILGVYHSHPKGPAEPSARDAGAAAYPGWIWLITALSPSDGDPVTRAFRHNPDSAAAFDPVEMAVRGEERS